MGSQNFHSVENSAIFSSSLLEQKLTKIKQNYQDYFSGRATPTDLKK